MLQLGVLPTGLLLALQVLTGVCGGPLLHHDLLGLGAHVDSQGALAVALAVWLGAVALAAWLDRAGRPGPVDALMRRLVYRAGTRDAG